MDSFYTTEDGADYSVIPLCFVKELTLNLYPTKTTTLQLCVVTNGSRIKVTDLDYSGLGTVLHVKFLECWTSRSSGYMVLEACFEGIVEIQPGDKVRIRRSDGNA